LRNLKLPRQVLIVFSQTIHFKLSIDMGQ